MKSLFAALLWVTGIGALVLFGLVPQFQAAELSAFLRFGFVFCGFASAAVFWILAAITLKS